MQIDEGIVIESYVMSGARLNRHVFWCTPGWTCIYFEDRSHCDRLFVLSVSFVSKFAQSRRQ